MFSMSRFISNPIWYRSHRLDAPDHSGSSASAREPSGTCARSLERSGGISDQRAAIAAGVLRSPARRLDHRMLEDDEDLVLALEVHHRPGDFICGAKEIGLDQ